MITQNIWCIIENKQLLDFFQGRHYMFRAIFCMRILLPEGFLPKGLLPVGFLHEGLIP